jgi:hypothetical protein
VAEFSRTSLNRKMRRTIMRRQMPPHSCDTSTRSLKSFLSNLCNIIYPRDACGPLYLSFLSPSSYLFPLFFIYHHVSSSESPRHQRAMSMPKVLWIPPCSSRQGRDVSKPILYSCKSFSCELGFNLTSFV